LLDHSSGEMRAHYARLHDTTVRRHWEKARKVNSKGEAVTIDPAGPLAEANWAKQRLGRATQALPNGFCGLPAVKTCPHANACLTCPMFVTTPEFLPQHRKHRQQVLQIITAAEGRGQTRLAEMNRQVLGSLNNIIVTLEADPGARRAGGGRCELTTPSTLSPLPGNVTNSPGPRRSKPCGPSTPTASQSPSRPSPKPRLSPDPGSTPSPMFGPRSNASAPPAAGLPRHRSSDASLLRRLEAATQRIRRLTDENRTLREQLAQALGERRATVNRDTASARTAHRSRSVTIGPC
jgi:hypothetical protein